MAKGRDIDDVEVGGGKGKRVKPEELVDIVKLPPKRYMTLRLIGQAFLYGGHWIKTKTREGKPTQFYTPCLAFDSETGKHDSTKKCPWCDHEGEEVRFAVDTWTNAIVRDLQKKKPAEVEEPSEEELESGFKSKDSETWTPVLAFRMGTSVVRSVKELRELNTVDTDEGTKTFGMTHPKYGCDIQVKHNPDVAPAQQYTVHKGGEPTPLKRSERGYLIWDLSNLQPDMGTYESELKEYTRWAEKMGLAVPKKKSKSVPDDDGSTGMDDDDEDEMPRKKTAPAKKSRTSPPPEDDDEDEMPRKKTAPAKKSRTSPPPEDDDDDEPVVKPKRKAAPPPDDDDDDDEPVVRKKSAASKRVVEDDDDDEDEPVVKKKPAAKKSRFEDDEDEDEPAVKPKRKAAPPPDDDDEDEEPVVKKKPAAKKRVVEDDDEDEDEPAAPRKKAAAKPAAKKSRFDDDDDED
jgi:hypothetical protein